MKFNLPRHVVYLAIAHMAGVTSYSAFANIDGQMGAEDSYFSDGSWSNDESFQFKSGPQLQTGQQPVDQSGTLFSNSHEGARSAKLSAEKYRLQMFGYQMQSAVRYDGLSYSYVPAKYNSGASLQLNDMRQWTVQSAFLTSSQSLDAGSSDLEASTWNVSANRQWLRDSLLTRVEYARSQNTDYNTRDLSDHAIDVHVDTLSMDWIQFPGIDRWNAGARYRSIGTEYYPAADIYLPIGLDEANVFFQPSIGSFTFDLGWREQNQEAIETMAQLGRAESRSMASVKYSPTIERDNLLRRVLGSPSLIAHFHNIDEIRPGFDVDGDLLSQPLFNEIDERGLTLQLAKPFMHWSVQYQESYQHPRDGGKRVDKTPSSIANGDRNSTFFTVGLTPSPSFSVTANAQWHRQFFAGIPSGNNQQLYNVVANYDVVPDAFSLSMQYDYVQSEGAFFTGSNLNWGAQNQVGSAALSWRAITFSGSRPAMDLSLKSSYGRFGDELAMNIDERWSAQLSMKMYWGQQQL